MTSNYAEIHRLLEKFYLKRRAVRMGYEVGRLSIAEAQLLVELTIEPGLSSTHFAEACGLNKSSISRLVQGLEKQQLLTVAPSSQDRRVKELYITDSGRFLVEQLEESQKLVLAECFAGLTQSEELELSRGLRILADGFGVADARTLEGAHPVTKEIIRLGRATGMTGGGFAGQTLSSNQYHMLSVIADSAEPPIAADLGSLFPLDASTISRTLSGLQKRGLINKVERASGRRSFELQLTEKGRALLSKIQSAAADNIASAMRTAPADSADRLVELLRKVVSEQGTNQELVLQDRIEIKPLRTLEDRQAARALLLEGLVRERRHHQTPDSMYGEGCRGYGLFVNDNLSAAVEVAAQTNREVQLSSYASSVELPEDLRASFIKAVTRLSS